MFSFVHLLREKTTNIIQPRKLDESREHASTYASIVIRNIEGLRSAFVHLIQDGHQKRGRLARSGLSAGHHVATLHDNRDRVFLYRRRTIVSGQRDVTRDDFGHFNFFELNAQNTELD